MGTIECSKASNPVEYAYSRNIQNEPAFGWWVHKVLKKRDSIVMKLKTNRRVKNEQSLVLRSLKQLKKLNYLIKRIRMRCGEYD